LLGRKASVRIESLGDLRPRHLRREERDPWYLSRLLRLDGERRGYRPGQRGQQEAAAVHHSIT
jgi:hypothetical protein